MGDFTPDRLDSRSLQTLWEWENRVLLEEYYIRILRKLSKIEIEVGPRFKTTGSERFGHRFETMYG